MNRWGYDDVNGEVVGDITIKCRLFYDGKQQKNDFYAKNDKEAMDKALNIKHKLLKEFGGHPCYLYQDNNKWELRMY